MFCFHLSVDHWKIQEIFNAEQLLRENLNTANLKCKSFLRDFAFLNTTFHTKKCNL